MRQISIPFLTLLLPALATTAVAQTFTIPWWTLDSGGGSFSTGQIYQLSGTIAQPDASTILAGGEFQLTGGFWPGAAAPGPVICRGDLNCDGWIDFADINPFIKLLANPSAWQTQYPLCPMDNADINEDGRVDFDDINPFIKLLTMSPIECP